MKELRLHEMVGKKYTMDEGIEVCKKMEVSPLKVDFRLLHELNQEYPDLCAGDIIGYLEMCDIPMTDAVRKLGICSGVLYA